MAFKFHINPQTGNPNRCSAQEGNCPFGGQEEHYSSKDEARKAYEVRMGEGLKKSLQLVPHEHEENRKSPNGHSFSAITNQPNGSRIQTINGQLVIIGKQDSTGSHKVFLTDSPIGWVSYDGAKKRWETTYPNSLGGRPRKSSVDAIADLMKRAAPRQPTPKGPAKGYDPGESSELDPYGDFPDNKSMTLGRLRQLSSGDLARVYNRLELSQHSASYSSEIQSDAAARRRVESVLKERGLRMEIATYGKLEPGQDYGSANSYRLAQA